MSVTTANLPQDLDKKRNGIFYTPSEVTSILCNWAIKSSQDNILEPSFGGCGFLNASRMRLTSLNCHNPKDRLFGCDKDPKAFDHLAHLIGITDTIKRFIHDDFLRLNPDDFAVDAFECVIGNPPYISHHNMSEEQKATAKAVLEASGIILRYKPSLWAYFIIHSLQFLKVGGRMAWILPSSFLYTDYANEVKEILQQHFHRSIVISLGERIFVSEGTEERTVVLLCEGWNSSVINGTMELSFATDLEAMTAIIDGWQGGSWQGTNYDIRPNLALMTDEEITSYSELITSVEANSFGDLCKIRIGIVTGANKFFVINKSSADLANLPSNSLSYVLARFGDVKGINLLTRDLDALKREDKRCLLIDTIHVDEIDGALKDYLNSFPEEERETNKTFKKRNIWHQPDDRIIPDAFFPYMQNSGPAILLNGAQVTCTNTVHRIFFDGYITPILKKVIAISMLSTLSQLSAEIEGRSYGSGVLKHEPSEAARIMLLLPSKIEDKKVRETFKQIDALLRKGMKSRAQALADQFVFKNYSQRARQFHLARLKKALMNARARRLRPSPKNNNSHNK